MINNDAWNDIKNSPKQFTDVIEEMMNGGSWPGCDNDIKVMRPIHSSELRAYVAGGNTINHSGNILSLMEKGCYNYVDDIINELKSALETAQELRDGYLKENDPLLYKAKKVIKDEK